MKSKISIIIFLALIVGLLLSACSNTSEVKSAPATGIVSQPQQPAQTAVTEKTSSPSSSEIVLIKNFGFDPETITVSAGSTVMWKNEDDAAHTVKFANFASEQINKGKTYEMTFSTKGVYDYTCGLHPGMKGKVIVE
jgi:plastocyanin